MILSSPIWLIALGPWLGVVAFLLWGRRRRVHVPFVRLWRGPIIGPRAKRSMEVPPVAVALALMAMLLGVLAAARPMVRGRAGAGGPPITIVIDRGLTMSARGSRDLRFREMAETVRLELARRFSEARVELMVLPGDRQAQTDLSGFVERATALPPTAVDTRRQVSQTVVEETTTAAGPLIVISDDPSRASDDRVIQVAPQTSLRDVTLASVAASERPKPQVMVRIRNHSSRKAALLIISSGAQLTQKQLDLPAEGRAQNYFVDLPRLGPVVSAELRVEDDVAADKRAWLVREGGSAVMEPQVSLPVALRRMIDVYHRNRPASGASARVAIVRDASQLSGERPGIVLAATPSSIAGAAVQVVSHPVTRHVRWDALSRAVRAGTDPPPGWTPLVMLGGSPVVASGPPPVRRVWIGFDAPDWARTPDFVVFWTNVFDWCGGGVEGFVAHRLDQWDAQWKPQDGPAESAGLWPGLYRRSDGALRAFNAPDVPIPSPMSSDWRSRLASISLPPGRRGLSMPLLVVALACLALAAMTWRRRNSFESLVRSRRRAAARSQLAQPNHVAQAAQP